VLLPLAVMELDPAVIVEVVASAVVLTKFTFSLSVMPVALIVPVMVAVPTLTDDVNVAVYVPFPLSVTPDKLPRVVESVTVAPPRVRLLPLASFACTVMVVVLVPLAVIVPDAAVMVVVAALAGPGINVTVSLSAIAEALSVPVMVPLPTEVGDVNVAV
jgi:hypothetical protein